MLIKFAFVLIFVLNGVSAQWSITGIQSAPSASNTASQRAASIQMLARWCTLNVAEQSKCLHWRDAYNATLTHQQQQQLVQKQREHQAYLAGMPAPPPLPPQMPDQQQQQLLPNVILECVQGLDKFDCYKKIFEDKADLMAADGGEVYTAGKYYNLLPIATEEYSSGPSSSYSHYYAVAVVKRGSGLTIDTLRGVNSCHGGVGTSAGWNLPISTLIEKGLLEVVDCNNHVKAATRFFNRMCAPDALNVQFNPTGDNPTSSCELCRGKIGKDFCTNQDPDAGSIGAMYCLIDGGGDVAFVKHTTLAELAMLNRSVDINNFELLCPNYAGSASASSQHQHLNSSALYQFPTAPITDFASCNWGQAPGRAIVTSSRKAIVQRRRYREFMRASARLFAGGKQQQQLSPQSQSSLYGNNGSFGFGGSGAPQFGGPMMMNQFKQPYGGGYLMSHQQQQMMTLEQDQMFMIPPPPMSSASLAPPFYLFDSSSYFGRDLIFVDQTITFHDLDDATSYMSYLPDLYRAKILKLYECPLRLVRWCVISTYEKDKCRQMRNAFASRNIKPDVDCVSAKNAYECMHMIKSHLADLITLDPADAFRAHRYFGLEPLAAEDYGTDTETPVQYAVAVVKRTDLTTNLWNLRSKRACGTAFGDMAGWHVPVHYLIQIKELYVTSCHVPRVAGEYFGRSCMPGAEDYDYNTLMTNPRALCLICYAKGSDYCSRSQREYFYGDTGAFRCINEGLGDVAFVRHTAVKANTDGRNTDQWARPYRQTDYELLCKDGRRKSVEKYKECNLAVLPSRIVMVAGHRTDIQRSYLWNMLNFAQQLFGSDTNPEFTMFESIKEHPDLIFSDACVQLREIQTDLMSYLGPDVLSILFKTDSRLCNSANVLLISKFLTLLLPPFVLYLFLII